MHCVCVSDLYKLDLGIPHAVAYICAGFTSWSSLREPVDVFMLLETLYSEYDKIAKKRKVFKVETVGGKDVLSHFRSSHILS